MLSPPREPRRVALTSYEPSASASTRDRDLMLDRSMIARLRRTEPDRMLGVWFAPPALRAPLILLYAFDHELARARAVTSSGPMALIRLHWWREVVEGADRRHPLALALRAALDQGVLGQEDLLGLIAAREAEAEPIEDEAAFIRYVEGTAGAVMRIGGMLLGAADSDAVALQRLGTGCGVALLLRATPRLRALGRDLLPEDGTRPDQLAAIARPLLATPTPRVALAATLPAILARRDLARVKFSGVGFAEDERNRAVPLRGLGDRLAVIRAGLLGRVGPSPGGESDDMKE